MRRSVSLLSAAGLMIILLVFTVARILPLAQARPRPGDQSKTLAPTLLAATVLFDRDRPLIDTGGHLRVDSVKFQPAGPEGPPPDPSGRVKRPDNVRGIYLTGWVAGLSSRVRDLLQLVDSTELNAVVIDVKDDTGTLSFKLPVPLAYQIGSGLNKVADPVSLMAALKARNIYSVARVVVFKDQVLPRRLPDLAVRTSDGRVFRDKAGFTWADPYSKTVWEYNVDVAKEAARLGFSEVQFDYVRFPDVRRTMRLDFPASDGRPKPEVIKSFLAYAREELKPYGVKVSADIFGLVTTVKDDLGIGQHLESLAEVVDYLSPMVYPSHYAQGEYGIPNPNAAPYTTVFNSLRDASRRLTSINSTTRLVPWLQDFSLGHRYGPDEVRAQIQAAYDLGITDWYLWNPSNRYTRTALLPRRTAQ